MSVGEDGVYTFLGWAVPGDRDVAAGFVTAEISTLRDGMAVSRVVGAAQEKFMLAPGHSLVVVRGTLMVMVGLGKTFTLEVGEVFDPVQHDSYFITGCTTPSQKITGGVGR